MPYEDPVFFLVAAAVAPAPPAAATPALTEPRTFGLVGFCGALFAVLVGFVGAFVLLLPALACALVWPTEPVLALAGAGNFLPDLLREGAVVLAALLGFFFTARTAACTIFFLIMIVWVSP